MKKRKGIQKKIRSEFYNSQYLKDFEEWLLRNYTLLKNIPLFRNWRLRRAYDKWNKEQD